MNQKITTFTDLTTWMEAHKLVIKIYKITKLFPKSETFGLVDQMRRAAVSITSNIAEGFGRYSFREKTRFYYISKGSITELKNQLLIARDVKIITDKQFEEIDIQTNITCKLLQGLISKTKELSFSSSIIQSQISNL
jgi:four helix bundle protein